MKQNITVVLIGLAVSLTALIVSAKNSEKTANVISQQERIVGGYIAAEGSAPYQVSLQMKWGHFCGGGIIANEWIATAAHCVVNKYPADIYVLTGTQDLTNSAGVFYYVDHLYVHCNYDNPGSSNDIALLHLNASIALNSKTQIVPLHSKPMEDGDDVILTGWGHEEYFGEITDRLKMIDLKYMTHRQCKAAHKNSASVNVGHICTFTKRGEGSCHSDSGSSLVHNGNLVGVVNWGRPCAVGYPDVHASTYFYLDWIRRTMRGDGKCNSHAFVK